MKINKKYISVAVALAAITGTMTSCSNEVDDIWDKSSAERLEAAKAEYRDLLCSAENGWQMLYFCNGYEQGYNFLIKFEENKGCTIATRNPNTSDLYAEESSMFDILADYGPVLSFNTYNTLFHIYADPDPDHDTVSDGTGSGGDYEFKIISGNSDCIYMRGKKWDVDIYMYPLSADKSWEQYFDDLHTLRESLFNKSIPTLWLTLSDGSRYSITGASTQVVDFVPEGGDPISQTTTVPFVMTEKGIKFMTAYPEDSEVAPIEFVVSADGRYLESVDSESNAGAGATIKAPVYSELFATPGLIWNIDTENMSGAVGEAYKAFVDGLKSAIRNYNLYGMRFGYTSGRMSLSILFGASATRTNAANFFYEVAQVSDNEAQIAFTGEDDRTGNTLLNRVPELTDFINTLGSMTFTLSADSDLLVDELTFTNKDNANDSFSATLQ